MMRSTNGTDGRGRHGQSRLPGRTASLVTVTMMCCTLMLNAWTSLVVAQSFTGGAARSSRRAPNDAEVWQAADELMSAVDPSRHENSYYPPFAKQHLDWIIAEVKRGALSIGLLKDPARSNLGPQALMASGIVGGRRTIAIVHPRLVRLLLEGGRVVAPFTRRQENDFMLALVHEAVHFENPHVDDLAQAKSRLREELRAWREVSLHVVRQLRQLDQPMTRQFIEVDEAFRACDDLQDCPLVRAILFRN